MAQVYRVFICSTFRDLANERTAVLEAIRRLQLQHDSMEYFGARTGQPLHTCLEEVRSSDILVVIVGHLYGTIEPSVGVSFSQAEYEEGHRLEKPCLVYIRDEDIPVLPRYVEQDPEKLRLLDQWKALLRERHTIASFRAEDDLSVRICADLAHAIEDLQRAEKERQQTQARLEKAERDAQQRIVELERRANAAEEELARIVEDLELSQANEQRMKKAMQEMADSGGSAIVQNVLHEVAQPAFSGLSCIEALRRRDRENGRGPSDDIVDYYLKRKIQESFMMVAFLNDRGRLDENTHSYSETRVNLLSDVLIPALDMVWYATYERHLMKSGDKLDPHQLTQLPRGRVGAERIRTVQSSLSGLHHSMSYDQASDSVLLYVEKYRLQQAFYNVFNNACKYHDRETGVRLGVYFRDSSADETDSFSEYFVIDIEDEGIGIEKSELQHIFDLGFRAPSGIAATPIPGSGRGLFVSRAILRGVGGELLLWQHRGPTIFRALIPKECTESGWIDAVASMRIRTHSVVREIEDAK